MLLMAEKGIRRGISHSFHQFAKANHKHMKDYDQNRKSPYIQCLDVNVTYIDG